MVSLRRKESRSMSSPVGMPLMDRRRSSQFEPVLSDRFEQIIMGGRWTEKESSGVWTERR